MTMTELSLDQQQPTETPAPQPGFGLSLGSIVLLTGILLTAAVFGLALAQRNQTQPTSGPAPDFTLTTLDGQTFNLKELKGKVVVVNFWASWCGPCRAEAPILERLWQQYKDKNVLFLGVAYTDTERNARAFIAEYQQTYPNGLDVGTKISDLYNITGVPETFVVDQQGNVAKFFMVPLQERDLKPVLDQLLAGGRS
jgi:cytochrome c biogenesis protein CcmG/thiol:disulfide interchange protein DsbE